MTPVKIGSHAKSRLVKGLGEKKAQENEHLARVVSGCVKAKFIINKNQIQTRQHRIFHVG